ncbi:QueT transporter family protein [Zongyangia hominis]|nr:QueT transporter family protein [Zongyangia hominis]
MTSKKTRAVVEGALIAALYAALSIALAPISFGQVQVRVSEALTLLPLFTPNAIWGVTIGCVLSNTIGMFMGVNILGFLDIIFGSLATLLAALITRKLKKPAIKGLPILAPLPPVLLNAVVVGAELTFVTVNHFDARVFLLNAAYVGLGQLLACYVLGLMLVWLLQRGNLSDKLFFAK